MVWLIVAGGALPILLFIGYMAHMNKPNKGPRELPKARATETLVGKQALAWRVLDSRGGMFSDGTTGGMVAGNFDQDVDEELLLVGRTSSRSYDYDGATHGLTLGGAIFSRHLTAWDYESDGVHEVIPDPRLYALSQGVTSLEVGAKGELPTTTPVFSVGGDERTQMPGFPIWSRYPLVGDVAGTGVEYLLLDDGKGSNVSFGRDGRMTRQVAMRSSRGKLVAVADVLGEKRQCLITLEGGGRRVVAYDRLNEPHFVGNVPRLNEAEDIEVVASDVNRDGKQDLIFAGKGYLNAKSGWIPLDYKFAAPPPDIATVCADLLKKGSRQIIMAAGKQAGSSDELLLFDKAGKLVHHERFARPIVGLARIRSPKQDYVCVQFEDRILIYP